MERDGSLTGFSIELWREIAERLKVETEYHVAPDPTAALDALRNNKADLLLPGIYITVERDREFDFSYMIWEGGQQIMVRDTGEGTTVKPTEKKRFYRRSAPHRGNKNCT